MKVFVNKKFCLCCWAVPKRETLWIRINNNFSAHNPSQPVGVQDFEPLRVFIFEINYFFTAKFLIFLYYFNYFFIKSLE